MSDKPSLYVVEKKEVVILVVLFVLVTVLSFTLGVRYGEAVGKKTAHEQDLAAKEHGEAVGELGGGTLGKVQGSAKQDDKAAAPHDPLEGGDAHKEAKNDAQGDTKALDPHSPENIAKAMPHSSETAPQEAVDKSSDEYLLNALKEAGVEPPGGKAPKDSKLPDAVKEPTPSRPLKALSGSFVIQVGSHPTRNEAESQVRQLKARRISAEILPPFKDKQGEWHRVVIGSYKNKRDADKEASGLKGKGSIVSFFVWRLP